MGIGIRWEGAGADLGRIGLDRAFDGAAELGIFLDEFWHARRKPKHILKHEDLPVTLRRGANADGGNGDLFGNPRREKLGQRLEDHRERAGLGDDLGILLELRPFGAMPASVSYTHL